MPPLSPHTPGAHRQGLGAALHLDQSRRAELLLGAGHPLVGVLYAYQATAEGILAVAAVQAAALTLWWTSGASFARALTICAGLVQLALSLRLAALRTERRDHCRELLIAGRERLPLGPLTRERWRLLDPRRRHQLACSLEQLADLGSRRDLRPERGRPIYNRRVLAAAEPQLRDLAVRLRAEDADVRGVASLDCLVTSGLSPLYGEQVRPLCEELARSRYLLA
jgi:hypothetical protein